MEEVILHIGTHKTGSTSIQNTLAGYDDGETIYSRLHTNGSHLRQISTIFAKDYQKLNFRRRVGVSRSDTERYRERYTSILDREISNPNRKRLILSSEAIWNAPKRTKENLLTYIQGKNINVTVVCYVRNTLDFASSWAQQRIRTGESKVRIIDTDLRNRLEFFRDRVGSDRVVVRHFSKERLHNECVVQDFCHLFGLEPKRIIRLNDGISATATKLVFHFNSSCPVSFGKKKLLNARRDMIKQISKAYPGKKLEGRYFQSVTPSLFDDREYVREEFGIEFPEPPGGTGEPADIEAMLQDLSDIDLQPLDDLLVAADFEPEFFPSPSIKLVALYYAQLMRKWPDRPDDARRFLASAVDTLKFWRT
ncbi:MAG: hypothetical protein QNJ35_03310 [Paracoccaceae bacterium]|nr:hypothetical protein [Paracoccaceae bacterium]